MNRIPPIANDRLAELAKRIKPVVRFGNGELRYIQVPRDLRNTSFLWNAKPKIWRNTTGLILLDIITTYHTFGYQGFFKPSIAEVLSQIPAKFLDRTVAFEVVGPSRALAEGHHVATTRLYEKEAVR